MAAKWSVALDLRTMAPGKEQEFVALAALAAKLGAPCWGLESFSALWKTACINLHGTHMYMSG